MFVLILIGLGASMMLLSPMQEPGINMAIASMGGSIGALTRNAPAWPLGSANQQQQPFAAFRQPRLRNIVSTQAVDPMIARSGYGGSWGAYTSPVVVRAESSLIKQLDEAIKLANECTGDCKVEWDNVEELSAAVAHSTPKELKSETLTVSQEDLDKMKEAMKKMTEARKKVEGDRPKDKMDPAILAEIASALETKQEIVSKVGTDRLARFEAKIQEAIATATASKSAVDWDIVEELMQERSHLKKFGGSA